MSGFVYFLTPEAVFHRHEEDLQMVKIGYTKFNPVARMRDLQCGSPVCLELFAYTRGTQATERAFHEAFAPLRAHGEWFYLHHKLRDFLGYLQNYTTPAEQRFVTREDLCISIYDNILAPGSPHPSISDEDYLASAVLGHLEAFYPEAVS